MLDNALRRKRKFSDMMNNSSIGITQGILNNNLHYKNKNFDEVTESLFFKGDYANRKLETKKRKIKNFQFSSNDYIYNKIEKDFGSLKLNKIENHRNNNTNKVNDELQLHSENSFENDCLLNNSISKSNCFSNRILLRKKCKYNEQLSINYQSKRATEGNYVKNNSSNNNHNNQIKSLDSFDYLIEDEEITEINSKLSSEKAFKKQYNSYIRNNNNNINEKSVKRVKSNLNNTKITIEDSFNVECVIDIDMNEFKNQPNNQNFFNSELIDLDTVNTSRNSNFDDLSLSFLTEYTNKNVSGNIISNAIETEKLMMKLFDICNPALQPTEK